MNYENLCYKTCDLAKTVGEYVRQQVNLISETDIITKGLHNFVTNVDTRSEKRIIDGLRKMLPESGFIAEEQTSTKKGLHYNWIVDPLDGTTNYIHGLSPYAISIALLEDEELVLGVVYEMSLKECFYAWKGSKAYMNGKVINVSKAIAVEESLIATGFPYYDYKRLMEFMKTIEYFIENSHGLRRLGSAATDLAYVACGRFDAFYEYSLSPWDVAAGAFIVQQAGGKIGDFKGENNYIFGKEIVASNSAIYDEFLSIIKKIMY